MIDVESLALPRRTLVADGLVNARDLGGLPCHDRTTTPRGVFFRSENLAMLTSSGWNAIGEAGVRTIVDLRQARERTGERETRPAFVETVQVDLDGLEHEGFWAGYWENGLAGTALYYLPHLEVLPERSVEALEAIVLAPEGGVLFHCEAGRDRTGMIAMLLLAAAGAEREAIVDDYLETVRLGPIRAAAAGIADEEPEIAALCRRHRTTVEGAFRSALAGLDLEAVLDAGGMSQAGRQALRSWRGAIPVPRDPRGSAERTSAAVR